MNNSFDRSVVRVYKPRVEFRSSKRFFFDRIPVILTGDQTSPGLEIDAGLILAAMTVL